MSLVNTHEQHAHRTVTAELRKRLDDAEVVVGAIEERLAQLAASVRHDVGTERTHRLKLADEQRAYVDARDHELRACCQERWDATAKTTKQLAEAIYGFRRLRLRDRVKWLLTGRVA